MASKLPAPEQEVFLNLLKTADILSRSLEEFLKPFGLSPTQYNVLRIIRAAADAGLPCGQIAERMLTRDPDITRLLDRLSKRGLLARRRQSDDRRVVKAFITDAGRELLQSIDEPILTLHRHQLSHLGPQKLKALTQLLQDVRATAPSLL